MTHDFKGWFLAAALLGCEGPTDDGDTDDAPGDTDSATHDDTDTGVEPALAELSAEITPYRAPSYSFSAAQIFGTFHPVGVFSIYASGLPNINPLLSFVVAGESAGTYNLVLEGDGSTSHFEDYETFSQEESVFNSTSGNLVVTRWDEADVPGPESWYVDGSFDASYTNSSPENPNPPITLDVVGEFSNALLITEE